MQLEELMKESKSNCVTFIGKLVISSFPKDYFLQKENTFSNAISIQHIETLYGNGYYSSLLLINYINYAVLIG